MTKPYSLTAAKAEIVSLLHSGGNVARLVPLTCAFLTDLFADHSVEEISNASTTPPQLALPTLERIYFSRVGAEDHVDWDYYDDRIDSLLPGNVGESLADFEIWLRTETAQKAQLACNYLWYNSEYMLTEVHELPLKLQDYNLGLEDERVFHDQRILSATQVSDCVALALRPLYDALCYAS